jgi:hypothetical protein
LAASRTARAEDLDVGPGQTPPLPAGNGSDCHIADATPLLDAAHYKSKGYALKKLQENPLILQETVSFKGDGPLALDVRQRGCEDIYVSLEFTFQDDPKMPRDASLTAAARGLKTLKLSPKALLDAHTLSEIAGALEAKAHSIPEHAPDSQYVACLQRLSKGECVEDVAVKFAAPKLKVIYVDRP